MDKFKDKLFAEAKAYGFSDCEAYYTSGNSFSVKIFNGEIAEYKNADSGGLSFRGTFRGNMGYSYTENPEIIVALVENAASNAGVIEEKEIEKLYPGDNVYRKVDSYNPALDACTSKEKIDLALALEKCAYEADPRVVSVDHCQLGTSTATLNIANSYGLNLSNTSNLAYAYVQARVEENGIVKTAHEIWHGNDISKFSYRDVAELAVNRALSYLGAKSVGSASYPIIFDNRTACSLMAAFSSVFFAENVQKGFSLLKGKVGDTIASPAVTLRDDGICNFDTFGEVAFDSEGVATKEKTIIENGVLKTFLYNTQSAAKDNTKSTGNGFKASFRSSISTACTNFYLMPGDKSLEDMVQDVGRGILITEMSGLHAGINPVSGDFSIASEGFLIDRGKIMRPVEQITVAGNFYSLLKNIECVANDMYFTPPSASGTFGMPSFMVRELPVSGL